MFDYYPDRSSPILVNFGSRGVTRLRYFPNELYRNRSGAVGISRLKFGLFTVIYNCQSRRTLRPRQTSEKNIFHARESTGAESHFL